MLREVAGFSYGIISSAGGDLAGYQRAAKVAGRAVPSYTTGRPGQGRASGLRQYSITVTRISDRKAVTETTPPGYHTRKQWQKMCIDIQAKLIAKLGG